MAFDWAGLDKAWMGGVQPRMYGASAEANAIRRAGGSIDDSDLGHATWKQDEIDSRNPYLLQQQAQYDQQALQDRQMAIQEQQAREAAEAKYKQEFEQWQQKQYMNRAFDYSFGQNLTNQSMQGDDAVIQKMKDAAMNAFKAGNGQAGLDLLSKANDMQKSLAQTQEAQSRASTARTDQIGTIMSQASDSDSWESAKAQLSKLGVIVPQQYNTWNDMTQKYAQQQAGLSKTVANAERIDLAQKALQAKLDADKANQNLAREKENRIAQQQAWNRERIERQEKLGKNVPMPEVKQRISELNDNEDFKDLSTEDKMTAARDLTYVERDILANNPKLSAVEAREQAKQNIYNAIKDGKYSTPVAGNSSAPQQQGSAPQAAVDYLKQHPELKDQFKAKFGYLPPGF